MLEVRTKTIVSIRAWVIRVEETRSEGGWIPKESGVGKASIKFDLLERTGVMTCSRLDTELGSWLKEEADRLVVISILIIQNSQGLGKGLIVSRA